MSTLADPLVNIKLGEHEKEVDFLINTGAYFSVLNQKLVPISNGFVNIIGATGQQKKAFFSKPLEYKLENRIGIHRFLYLPNSPKSLLRRDLLEQLETTTEFNQANIELKVREEQLTEILSVAMIDSEIFWKSEIDVEEIFNQVHPGVWASEGPGKSKNAIPIIIELKEGVSLVNKRQYPLKLEDQKGIEDLISKFVKNGLLVECKSDYNTPILPVKKLDGTYHLVQDLRAVNKIAKDLHPMAANPCTLLTKLRDDQIWLMVLDLKDEFFCLPLALVSQKLLAFEWENATTGRKTQLMWTVLPQGFENSPTIIGNQPAQELEMWKPPEGNRSIAVCG